MTEDDSYAIALKEVQSGKFNEGLMARCFVESNGDEKAARIRYVKLRASRIIEEFRQEINAKRQAEEKILREKLRKEKEVFERTFAFSNEPARFVLAFIATILYVGGIYVLASAEFLGALILFALGTIVLCISFAKSKIKKR